MQRAGKLFFKGRGAGRYLASGGGGFVDGLGRIG
jgi:hypothetical protein